MRLFTVAIILAMPFLLSSQAQQATLLGNWQDDSIILTSWLNSRYNEVWGVAINDLEIGIIGSTEGVHFINVTDPNNPVEIEAAFVEGAAVSPNLVHRDYHDYAGYLYTVADEGASTLQVIDMSFLPDSTSLIYNSSEHISRAHNIFIDEENKRLYACGTNIADLQVFSLENPRQPELLANLNTLSNGNLPYPHDLYVRDNIAYLNCGNNGFYMADLSDLENPILLGTMTDYPQAGYNHAGWLDQTAHYYYLADETHGTDLKVVDVCNPDDIGVMQTFDAEVPAPTSIAHNLIIRCNLLYVSYYYDGLQVFDITDPLNPERIAYYDTYDGVDEDGFKGAWGIYPLLPSGNILLSDMQTGLYVFEALPENCDITPPECETSLSTGNLPESISAINVFPQPAQGDLYLQLDAHQSEDNVHFELFDINGQRMQQLGAVNIHGGEQQFHFSLRPQLPAGLYVLKMRGNNINYSQKISISK